MMMTATTTTLASATMASHLQSGDGTERMNDAPTVDESSSSSCRGRVSSSSIGRGRSKHHTTCPRRLVLGLALLALAAVLDLDHDNGFRGDRRQGAVELSSLSLSLSLDAAERAVVAEAASRRWLPMPRIRAPFAAIHLPAVIPGAQAAAVVLTSPSGGSGSGRDKRHGGVSGGEHIDADDDDEDDEDEDDEGQSMDVEMGGMMGDMGHGDAFDHNKHDKAAAASSSAISSASEHVTASANSSSTSSPAATHHDHATASHSGGGHVHHSAHYVPLEYLDESNIVRWHGADPLSWLHWDWSFDGDAGREEFLRTGKSEFGDASKEVAAMGGDELEAWRAAQREATGAERVVDYALEGGASSHRLLIVLHVLSMCVAFFVALPVAIALKAAGYKNVLVMLGVKAVYASMAVLGWLTGWMYKELSPELYAGQKHGFSSNLLLLSALAVSSLDLISLGRRVRAFAKLKGSARNWNSFKNVVLYGTEQRAGASGSDEYERIMLNEVDVEEPLATTTTSPWTQSPTADRPSVFRLDSDTPPSTSSPHHVHFANAGARRPERADSGHSDTSTLRESPAASDEQLDKQLKRAAGDDSRDVSIDLDEELPDQIFPARRKPVRGLAKFAKYSAHFFERSLVIWAFIELCWGIVIYTGMARGNYLPGLLAHYIKGAIFFLYGILTFSRYLGAWAEYGWAWNRRPQRNTSSLVPTAEMVECFVIWLYGATNTWMERFGAAPGSPYSVKQVQHISIAVMFGGAGLIGMALEARWVRRLLSSTIFSKTSTGEENVREPRSYGASMNPFPALVIGVLGIAMSAHMQDYQFQIQVHALWGYLLAGFSAFRLLTYFFLFIAPTTDSVLPARPPTEAMAALMLSCGGVVFVLSDEEVTFAAMRHGWDDLMAFMNVTFAFVCMVFSWVLIVLTLKGWAVRRSVPRLQAHTRRTSRSGGEAWEDA